MGAYRFITLTDEQKSIAINRALEGASLVQIHEALGVDHQLFYEARLSDPQFSDDLARARDEGWELKAETLLEIYDLEPDVQKARGKSENLRWFLAKKKPLVYGDRIDVNLNQTVDIKGALNDAESRLNAARDVTLSGIVESETMKAIESRDIPDTPENFSLDDFLS